MKEGKMKTDEKKMLRKMHLIKSIFAIFSEILQQTKRKTYSKNGPKGKKTTTIVSQ